MSAARSSRLRSAVHSAASTALPCASARLSNEYRWPTWQRQLQDALLPALGQDAAALRAHQCELLLLRGRPDRRGAGTHVVGKRRAADERGDRVGDERGGRDGVDGDVGDGVGRHARVERVLGVLHDGGAAVSLDDRQTGRAVVPRPGQHDADHARTVRMRGGAEERVDRGAVVVLPWADRHAGGAALHHQVVVGRRDEDVTATQGLPVHRRAARQIARPAEDLGEGTRARRGDVQHDADRGREVCGKPRGDGLERLDATGRRADHDEVSRPSVSVDGAGSPVTASQRDYAHPASRTRDSPPTAGGIGRRSRSDPRRAAQRTEDAGRGRLAAQAPASDEPGARARSRWRGGPGEPHRPQVVAQGHGRRGRPAAPVPAGW